MDRDDLSLMYVSLELAYLERPRFAGANLPRLYANLTEHYQFERFNHDHDLAIFQQESQRTLTVMRSSLIIEEQVMHDVSVIKREVSDIAKQVKDHLTIRSFWEPQIVLRALWPVPGGNEESKSAFALMRHHAVNLNDDQLKRLGVSEVSSVILEVEALDEQDKYARHVNVKVGPYLRDPSQLHIELTRREHLEIQTSNLVESWMQDSYDYFMNSVVGFADSITH